MEQLHSWQGKNTVDIVHITTDLEAESKVGTWSQAIIVEGLSLTVQVTGQSFCPRKSTASPNQLRHTTCLWHFRSKLQHIVSNWQIETQTLEELPFMVFTLRGATITFCGWESESHRSCDLCGGLSPVVTNKGIPTKTPWSPHRIFLQIYCQGSEDSWEAREQQYFRELWPCILRDTWKTGNPRLSRMSLKSPFVAQLLNCLRSKRQITKLKLNTCWKLYHILILFDDSSF